MVRYKKIGYIALNVTDVARSAEFYEEIVGLQKVESNDEVAYLRCSTDHHNIMLYKGEKPGLKRVGLEVEDPEQLEIAYNHFKSKGFQPEYLSKEEYYQLSQGPTFRFQEPVSKVTFELYSDMTQMHDDFKPTVSKIARLGHVVIQVPNMEETIDSFMTNMNFKLSDQLRGTIAFMRCFPNPYHHSIGVGSRKERMLHHVNFMVSDIDDIGTAIHRLADKGVTIVNGPGRHNPSGSIFLYFLDPDGMTVEYSFGMEEFPEDGARKARILEKHPRTLDLWGGKKKPGFAEVGYIEGS